MIIKDKTLVAFGKHLMELRKEKDLTQEELASRCDLNRNYVGSIERAEKNPSLTTLVKLADGLGVSRAELLEF